MLLGRVGDLDGFVAVFFLNLSSLAPDDLDARVLGLVETPGEGRHLGFREAVGQLTQSDWPKWPVLGPRTTMWVCRFIRDHDIAPRSRHTKWKAETGLTSSDQAVADHEFCLRLLQTAVLYDQLNVSELACFELVSRRARSYC